MAARARQQREDEADPGGMEMRAKARMEQNLSQKAKNYARATWLGAHLDRTIADKLVEVAEANVWRAEKEQWALADAGGASSSTSKWRPRSQDRGHSGAYPPGNAWEHASKMRKSEGAPWGASEGAPWRRSSSEGAAWRQVRDT